MLASIEESSSSGKRNKYNEYTAEERAKIGKYAAENGPARAVRHFSTIMTRKLPESTARRLESEYLVEMKALIKKTTDKELDSLPRVLALPKLTQGRPLLLGQELDKSVQNFVESMRKESKSLWRCGVLVYSLQTRTIPPSTRSRLVLPWILLHTWRKKPRSSGLQHKSARNET